MADPTGKSRGAHLLGRTLRVPGAVLDRKGTRWALQALSPAPVIVIVHRGRKSGRLYKTPVEVIREDRERDEIVVAPMWGKDSDWYRNVLAGGLVEVHVRDEERRVEWRKLDEAERRLAMDAYRDAHPRYSRLILRMLVSVNRLEGDPEEAVLRELPMLGLRRVGAEPPAAKTGAQDLRPGDEAPPEEPSAGENVCPDCGGSGELDGQTCPTCEGTGRTIEAIGGG